MPQSIRHLGDIPLYQAVIWWGYYLEREFNRNELSQAFRIDHRRASAILNYICHRLTDQQVELEFHNKSVNGGRCRLYVTITSVSFKKTLRPGKSENSVPKTDSRDIKKQDRELARWFLSRPLAEDQECIEKWITDFPVTQKK